MHTHNWFAWAAIGLGQLGILMALRGPIARWVRKVKRRRGGVYLWRVDHHQNRARRVNGYVGETVSFYFRSRQHMGMSRFDAVTGQVVKGKGPGVPMVKVPAQPWSDLNPVMHKVIKLPWWLCWKWVLRPLETLVILCTWPVYNDAKNRWNPRRVSKGLAQAQRATRESGGLTYTIKAQSQHALGWVIRAAGVLVMLTGVVGWAVTR
jgi:hypothetical protein